MNKEEAGKWGLLLIILFFFLEYVRPQSFIPLLAPLHIPMLVQILVFFTLFGCGLARLRTRESIIFFVLLCLMALHVPFARNNYWALQTTRTMTLHFIVFLGIVGLLNTPKKLTLVLTFWIVVAVMCAVKGYFSGGKIPGSAFLGDENDFSLFLNMMIPIAFFAGQVARSKPAKAFFYFGIVILVLGTVTSMSRGGFLGMLPPLLYCWWKAPRKLLTAAGGVLIGSILIFNFISAKFWVEMKTIQGEGTAAGTGEQRVYLWSHGFSMFLDHPLLGVGPGNFNWNLELYEPLEGFKGRSHAGRPSHSIYFTLLPELGLSGTFLFFSIIWVNLSEGRRLRKRLRTIGPSEKPGEQFQTIKQMEAYRNGLTGAMIAYLISGAFLSVLYYGHIWHIFAFSAANNKLLRQRLQQLEKQPKPEGINRYENSSIGWQYTRISSDYPLFR
jgi:hypothetical protein